MTGINLLPDELKKEIRQREINAVIFSFCFYIILIFLVGLFGLELGNRYLYKVVSRTQSEIENLQREIATLKKIEDDAKKLNESLDLMEQAEKSRVFWSNVLKEIALCTPSRLRIENIEITTSKQPNFAIVGSAESIREAVKFKEKLEASPYFTNTSFLSTNRTESAGKILYGFKLSFDLERKK